MKTTVRWTVTALSEFDEAIAFIAGRDEAAALAVKGRVVVAVERLARHSTGRPGRVAGYFEKPVPKTRLTLSYKALSDGLVIVRCIHQSRDWPADDWPADKHGDHD